MLSNATESTIYLEFDKTKNMPTNDFVDIKKIKSKMIRDHVNDDVMKWFTYTEV